MCLGIPARINKINDSIAEVEIGGVMRKASLDLVDDVYVGEYVILHAGFAIAKLDEKEAQETLRLLEEIGV
ncbi:HypC/HybG/HupF family hydrogenase formation chaperone [Candidatus Desantisbacteria bacterium]|nr:HypC/HybG/HupF family hydrogenase formation chaperone [Candidatus Desantisbacteria bacterium]